MSVVLNTTVPSSELKKKPSACAYHRIRECIAAKIVTFFHIKSEDNIADIFTNPLDNFKFLSLARIYLFHSPGWSPKEQDKNQRDTEEDETIAENE